MDNSFLNIDKKNEKIRFLVEIKKAQFYKWLLFFSFTLIFFCFIYYLKDYSYYIYYFYFVLYENKIGIVILAYYLFTFSKLIKIKKIGWNNLDKYIF